MKMLKLNEYDMGKGCIKGSSSGNSKTYPSAVREDKVVAFHPFKEKKTIGTCLALEDSEVMYVSESYEEVFKQIVPE
jgi:hypothetical protein